MVEDFVEDAVWKDKIRKLESIKQVTGDIKVSR